MNENEIKERIKKKIEIAKEVANYAGESFKKETFSIVLKGLLATEDIYTGSIQKMKEVSDKEYSYEDEVPKLSSKSCRQAILEVLSSRWGRKSPKTVQEIKDTLELNALYFPSSTIPATLNQLTKANKVRRVKKEEGVFSYVIID